MVCSYPGPRLPVAPEAGPGEGRRFSGLEATWLPGPLPFPVSARLRCLWGTGQGKSTECPLRLKTRTASSSLSAGHKENRGALAPEKVSLYIETIK